MIFSYPDIDKVFDTENNFVNTIVIENQKLMFDLLTDISNQQNGSDGRATVFDKGKLLSFDKSVELLTDFIPFDLNKRQLITKANSLLEKSAVSGEHFLQAGALISGIEEFLYKLAFDMPGNIYFPKIGIDSVIKAAGLEFTDDYDSLGEKIIDYFELVNNYIGKKLFIAVNLRSYINDDECEKMLYTVLNHCYNFIMIENKEHKRLPSENRIIIDGDLCVIS